jgi:hypothetical protein
MFHGAQIKLRTRILPTMPTRRPTYLLGTISGQVATALVQMLLLVGFGAIVLHLDWGQYARPRADRRPSAGSRAGGICDRVLCHRGLAVPLRVNPESD